MFCGGMCLGIGFVGFFFPFTCISFFLECMLAIGVWVLGFFCLGIPSSGEQSDENKKRGVWGVFFSLLFLGVKRGRETYTHDTKGSVVVVFHQVVRSMALAFSGVWL